MSRKSKIIVSIVGIVLISLILLGLTFGYYLTQIVGNTNSKSITLSIANLELTYDDGNGLITAEKIIPGENIDTKTFTVENTGNAIVENYTVYLDSVVNTFADKNDVNLTLTCTSSKGGNCNGTNMTYPSNSTMLSVNTIEVGEIHYYELIVEFLEKNEDQSDNMNKSLSGNVVIKDLKSTDKSSSTISSSNIVSLNGSKYLNNYKIFGNSEHNYLPVEYQQVQYIESTGTQYIDTGVIANENTGIDIEFLTKDTIGTGNFGSILGARLGSSNNELQLTTYSDNPTTLKGTLRYGTGGSYNAGITQNTKMHLTLKNKVYSNNVDVSYTLTNAFQTPSTITVFALNNNGQIVQNGKVQLYSLKIYNGNSLIRDYIPCYRKKDTVVGLFDIVENKFYENGTSTSFSKGSDVSSQVSITPDTPQEISSVGDYDEATGKYLIPIKATGKNLFNPDDWYNFYKNNTGSNLELLNNNVMVDGHNSISWHPANGHNGGSILYSFSGKSNTQYTVTFTCKQSSITQGVTTGIGFIYSDGTASGFYCANSTEWNDVVGVSSAGKTVVALYMPYNYGTVVHFQKESFRLYEGRYTLDTIDDYEPYHENTYNIYLDEPLRKVGNCNTCIDYIDFQEQKLYRYNRNMIFDGTEDWRAYGNGYAYYLDKSFNALEYNALINNYFPISSQGDDRPATRFQLGTPSNRVYIFDNSTNSLFGSLTGLKQWLVEKNTNGRPLNIIYNTSLSTQNITLPNINLESNVKYISIDTEVLPSNIEFSVID